MYKIKNEDCRPHLRSRSSMETQRYDVMFSHLWIESRLTGLPTLSHVQEMESLLSTAAEHGSDTESYCAFYCCLLRYWRGDFAMSKALAMQCYNSWVRADCFRQTNWFGVQPGIYSLSITKFVDLMAGSWEGTASSALSEEAKTATASEQCLMYASDALTEAFLEPITSDAVDSALKDAEAFNEQTQDELRSYNPLAHFFLEGLKQLRQAAETAAESSKQRRSSGGKSSSSTGGSPEWSMAIHGVLDQVEKVQPMLRLVPVAAGVFLREALRAKPLSGALTKGPAGSRAAALRVCTHGLERCIALWDCMLSDPAGGACFMPATLAMYKAYLAWLKCNASMTLMQGVINAFVQAQGLALSCGHQELLCAGAPCTLELCRLVSGCSVIDGKLSMSGSCVVTVPVLLAGLHLGGSLESSESMVSLAMGSQEAILWAQTQLGGLLDAMISSNGGDSPTSPDSPGSSAGDRPRSWPEVAGAQEMARRSTVSMITELHAALSERSLPASLLSCKKTSPDSTQSLDTDQSSDLLLSSREEKAALGSIKAVHQTGACSAETVTSRLPSLKSSPNSNSTDALQ